MSIYFDHLIEKESRPDISMEEWNIAFVCGECHDLKGKGFPRPEHQLLINKAIEMDQKIKDEEI